MTKHIFDTNVLRNLAISDILPKLPAILEGDLLYVGSVVLNEFKDGANQFGKQHDHLHDHLQRSECSRRFKRAIKAITNDYGFEVITPSLRSRYEEFAYALCLQGEMDDGEAEAFAIAAHRGMILYSDDLQVRQTALRIADDDFPCPPFPDKPPATSLTIHSTIWLLKEGVDKQVLTLEEASVAYDLCRSFDVRLPNQSLASIFEHNPDAYW